MFVTLGDTLPIVIITRVGSTQVPTNSTAEPTYNIYDSNTSNKVMTGGAGTTAKRHTGTITGVADDGGGECRITCNSHGLATGQVVTVSGVNGATGANITASVTVITANTFDLDGSTFGGVYTNGGTFNTTGVYYLSEAITSGNGYAAGNTYSAIFNYAISSTNYAEKVDFTVT